MERSLFWMDNPPDSIHLFFRQFWRILKMDYPSETDHPSLVWKRPLKRKTMFYLLRMLWLLIYYTNANEIPGELSRKNKISSQVKITCYLHMWKDHRCYGYQKKEVPLAANRFLSEMVWYFIGVYIINKTFITWPLGDTDHSSCVLKIIFQLMERNFLSPRGHVISSILQISRLTKFLIIYPKLNLVKISSALIDTKTNSLPPQGFELDFN